MQLNFDYTEQVFTVKFVLDIISRIGGYMAAFLPFMQIGSPILLFYFMHSLSDALRSVKTREYFNKSKDFLTQVKAKLLLILKTKALDRRLEELIKKRIINIEKV
jgi:hypothetical protein